MANIGRVHQVNVSPGGVPKKPVACAHVGPLGLEGDAVSHPKIHGGPLRAVCLYSLERVEELRLRGHPVFPGALGENLTLSGLDWTPMEPGRRLRIGHVELEITRYTTPCATTAPYVSGRKEEILQERSPGYSRVYARVLQEGKVRPGMRVELLPRSA